LVKQTLPETKEAIKRRLDFIMKEQARVELMIRDVENKINTKRTKIQKMQETFY
jgi:hypothetical protein